MILIKGSQVQFELEDGSKFILPPKYGIFHDPEKEGNDDQANPVEQAIGITQPSSPLKFCEVIIGPYETTEESIELTPAAKKYYGRNYSARKAIIDIPDGPWQLLSMRVIQIFYRRPAGERPAKWRGKYYHPFKRYFQSKPLPLEQCGNYFRLRLGENCRLDDRGFIVP